MNRSAKSDSALDAKTIIAGVIIAAAAISHVAIHVQLSEIKEKVK